MNHPLQFHRSTTSPTFVLGTQDTPSNPKAPARWAASQPVAHVRSPQLLGLSESRLPLPGHANLSSGMEFLAIKRPYSAPSATLHVSRIREWAGLLQAVIPNKFGSDLI